MLGAHRPTGDRSMRTTRWARTTTGLAAVLAFVSACGHGGAPRAGASAAARRIVGMWEADFALRTPPLAFDSAALRRSPHGDVHATLAFVPNTWLEPASADVTTPATAPVAYGTFDADFTPFGFEPREGGRVPTAVVSVTGDSVLLLLGPGGDQTSVYVAAVWRGDSAVGTWRLQSSGRAGATASGGVVIRALRPLRAMLRTPLRTPDRGTTRASITR